MVLGYNIKIFVLTLGKSSGVAYDFQSYKHEMTQVKSVTQNKLAETSLVDLTVLLFCSWNFQGWCPFVLDFNTVDTRKYTNIVFYCQCTYYPQINAGLIVCVCVGGYLLMNYIDV